MNSRFARFTCLASIGLTCFVSGWLFAGDVVTTAPSDSIAPWIATESVLVAQIDLHAVNPQSTGEVLRDLLVDKSTKRSAQELLSIAAAAEAWLKAAQQAGVRKILAVTTCSPEMVKRSPWFLVIPDHRPLKQEQLRSLFAVSDDSPLRHIERVAEPASFVIGPPDVLQAIEAQGPGEAAKFETALASVSEFPIRLAFSWTDDHRRVFREMFPQLPAPLSAWNGKTIADGVMWKAVGIGLVPKLRIRSEIESLDGESAQQLLTAWTELIGYTLQRIETTAPASEPQSLESFESLRSLKSLASCMTPSRNKSRLQFDFDAEDVRLLLRQWDIRMKMAGPDAARSKTINQIRQLALAHANYEFANGHLPDVAIRDAAGKPLLSWRVAVLPYLEEMALYNEFHLDEPWDSPHNSKLIAKMPDVFRIRTSVFGREPTSNVSTRFLVPVGEGLIFGQPGGIKFREIVDGTSKTLLIVTVPEDQSVVWTKPTDWNVDLDRPKASILPAGRAGFVGVRSDGSSHWIDASISPEKLRALLTINGRETIE